MIVEMLALQFSSSPYDFHVPQEPIWRAAIDDRMVDDIFFDARDAMQTVDKWEAGHDDLTFHPVERRWLGNGDR